MTASSVTGIGQGSADKSGQKGSEHLFVGVEKLIGPRIMFASTATLAAGVVTVTLPQPLLGVDTDYILLATDVGTGKNPVSYSAFTPASVGTFVLNGTGTDVVAYAIIRVNNASTAASITPNGQV